MPSFRLRGLPNQVPSIHPAAEAVGWCIDRSVVPRVHPTSTLPLRVTFGGIGSNQTRDQISGWSFLLPFDFSAAARRLQVACEGPR